MTNVIMTGVGGQGVLLACRVLMETALLQGYDAKESEIHGMAQRGGSVVTHVRFGAEEPASPLISENGADFIVAFELCEAVRTLPYLKGDGLLLVNNLEISPSVVQSGMASYPEDLDEWLSTNVSRVRLMNTEEACREAGSKRCLNIVMLGALSAHTDIAEEHWLQALRSLIKPKYLDVNEEAFRLGSTSEL